MKKLVLLGLVLMAAAYYSCQKEEIEIVLTPDAGSSFLDVENDGYVVSLTAEPAPEGQTGTWRLYNGENGRFEDIHDPHTKFYGEPGETYLLGWELSAGDQYKAQTINVSFKPLNPVIITQVADTLRDNVSIELEAEAAKFGAVGQWEIVDGNGGRIESPENNIADFIGAEGSDYTLRWKLTYGSKEASVDLSFVTDTLRAYAGEDDLDILTKKEVQTKYYNLAATLPAGATGTWKLVSENGGKIYTTDDPYSVLEGVADSVYTLTWTVKIDQYESTDTLQLRFRGKWGVFIDSRDKQQYRFAEVGELQWMAENFNYALTYSSSGYGKSWYYGQTARADISDGHPVETEEEKKFYGRIYNYFGAEEAAPEGWRLPTIKDVEELFRILGGKRYAIEKIKLGGETGIDFYSVGGMITWSGSNPVDFRDVFAGQGTMAGYLTSNISWAKQAVKVILFSDSGNGIQPMHFALNGVSVRYVRDIPPR